MTVIDVLLLRTSVSRGYVLRFCFDSGFVYDLKLSHPYYLCHPFCVTFSTQPGFVPRPPFVNGSCSLPFVIDSSRILVLSLPTCCGYLSSRGKWLTTGSFYRCCIVYLDELFSSL